jgi:hypothetical protein
VRQYTLCDAILLYVFLFITEAPIIISGLERGCIQRGVRERLVQPVWTVQILHQDAHREGPAAGETHRGQVRDPLSASLCFGECNTRAVLPSRLLTGHCELRERLHFMDLSESVVCRRRNFPGANFVKRPAFARYKPEIFGSECLDKIYVRVALCLGLESGLYEWSKQHQGCTMGPVAV